MKRVLHKAHFFAVYLTITLPKCNSLVFVTGKTGTGYKCTFLHVLSEDLSKSEDKEDMKKEGEDGKGAKRADDSEVNNALISISLFFFFQYILISYISSNIISYISNNIMNLQIFLI